MTIWILQMSRNPYIMGSVVSVSPISWVDTSRVLICRCGYRSVDAAHTRQTDPRIPPFRSIQPPVDSVRAGTIVVIAQFDTPESRHDDPSWQMQLTC